MTKRTIEQNKKYQKLIAILYEQKKIYIWDGRLEEVGFPNPYIIIPRWGSILSFRNFMKIIDLDYPKDENGRALSSTKLSIEELGNHINFLDVLCAELEGK